MLGLCYAIHKNLIVCIKLEGNLYVLHEDVLAPSVSSVCFVVCFHIQTPAVMFIVKIEAVGSANYIYLILSSYICKDLLKVHKEC